MKRPDHNVIVQMAHVVRHNKELAGWLSGWYWHELGQLPHAKENVALAQGRCQVLAELHKFMQESPDNAAQLRKHE